MEEGDIGGAVILAILFLPPIVFWLLAYRKRKKILKAAEQQSELILADAMRRGEEEGEKAIQKANERVERLNLADKEIVARLKKARAEIESLTDESSRIAADIELLTEEDLLSSQSYQEDRKKVKAELKKRAVDAIDGVKGGNSNVNIGKFVAISAKADIAGALLLTTCEMLCTKIKASNGHQAMEKMAESIVAVEALVKCIDSRARINARFRELLVERIQLEIHFKTAKEIAREEQRELRAQQREETKVRQEAERAQKAAEKEEKIKAEAIAELKLRMAEQSEAERAGFQEELQRLQMELEDAHARSERAKSRAQETKQGHVYVISNIGSFGESVLKIGMTRRLEPMDRVKELGDASVPFQFDVHALIESDDAPKLETELHKHFDKRRVNRVNRRKEFFTVNIDEIEGALKTMGIEALVNRVASADEYYVSAKQ